jgi:hypothetical protein
MNFTSGIELTVDADTVFAYVGNVEKLPQYLPDFEIAPDMWVKVLPERRLQWGAESNDDYHGELSVAPTSHGARLMVTLHLAHGDREKIEHDLAAALAKIKQRLEH